MYIFDWNFRRHPYNYIVQSLLAVGTIVLILFFLDIEIQTALIASLGATAFTVFSRPHHFMSSDRSVGGGYIAGIMTGLLFDYLSPSLAGFISMEYVMIVTGGLAVGVAIFIMVMTNTEHAPAAGIALGLTLNEWNIKTLLFIAAAVIFIMLIRRLLKPFMINLIGEELSRPRSGMRLTSPAFREGDMIPEKYASDGEDISPPLNIEKVPPGTSSLVLSMTDYRGFMGCCQHWVVWNIPPETIEIKEGENPPGIQGLNDFDRLEYIGPLSLPGTHSYMFKLYALDSKLNLPEGSSILKVERAMCGKIIEKTVLEVKYRGRC